MSTESERSTAPVGAQATEPPPDRLPPEVRRIGFVVIIGVIMALLDSTIVNVGLNELSRGLGMPIETGQWTVTTYLLALAAAAPVSTWAARRLGAREMYLGALVTFTVGSVLCGLAQEPWQLITCRAVQGAAAGIIAPTGQMILVRAAGPQRIARALAAFGIPVTLAPVLGPPLGGVLVGLAGWRWIFLVNLPIGILGAILAMRVLPRTPTSSATRFDIVGFALITPGMVALTFGLVEAGEQGRLDTAGTLGPLLAGIALLAIFMVRAPRVDHPLMDLRLYANGSFSLASATTFALGGVIFGATILIPLFVQLVKGEGALASGLLLTVHGVGMAVAMMRASDLYKRFGPNLILAGTAVILASSIPLIFVGTGTPYWVLGVLLAVRGAGIGLASMPVMSAAYAAVGPSHTEEVSTQLNVLQRLGGSLATAILIVVLHQQMGDALQTADTGTVRDAFGASFAGAGVVTLLAVLPALVLALVHNRRTQAAVQEA